MVLVQDIPLGNYLVRVERERLTTSLERDAFLLAGRAGELLKAGGRGARGRGGTPSADYGEASGARVVIVDAAGTAVATSDDDQAATGSPTVRGPKLPPR